MFKLDELLKATSGKLVKKGNSPFFKSISIDSRAINEEEVFIAIEGKNFDGHDFISMSLKKKAACIIYHRGKLSPHDYNSAATFIKVKNTTKALGDIASYQRKKFDIPFIVVTGSCGKTTAKEMIASVLSTGGKVLKNEGTKNNQIGLPLTLLKLNSSYDFAVLEAGSNHPGEIAYLAAIARPNIAVINNIAPAHLEFFKDLDGVLKEKISLLRYLDSPAIALLNTDDLLLAEYLKSRKRLEAIFSFGIKNKSDFFVSFIESNKQSVDFLVNARHRIRLKALGYYNIYNALTAIAVGRILGFEYAKIREGFRRLCFPQSRLRLLKFNRLKFIDDTYNSNPLSLRLALDMLKNYKTKGRKIFIMGDMLELGTRSRQFHREAGFHVADSCDAFITVGSFSRQAAYQARECGLEAKNIFCCKNIEQARGALFKKIAPGANDIVLIKGSRGLKMENIFQHKF